MLNKLTANNLTDLDANNLAIAEGFWKRRLTQIVDCKFIKRQIKTVCHAILRTKNNKRFIWTREAQWKKETEEIDP